MVESLQDNKAEILATPDQDKIKMQPPQRVYRKVIGKKTNAAVTASLKE